MKIQVEATGLYGPENGEATGKPFGRVRFDCNDGRHFEASIRIASYPPDCYEVDCCPDTSSGLRWGFSVILEGVPFGQAAFVIAGMMLHEAARTRREEGLAAYFSLTCPPEWQAKLLADDD